MDNMKIAVILNGKKVEAKSGERLVEIVKRNRLFLPHPCYHKHLSETGHCGMCLVGARRQPTDNFTVVFACTATANDNMEIDTEFPEAVSKRYEIFMLYLAHHPMDCSKCDKAGKCFLHKFSSQTRFRGFSRIENGKLIGVKYKDFGGDILFDDRKCIGCKRCIRFCRDILGEDILGFLRGENGIKTIGLYPGKTLDNNYSQNLVELCPAGAFVNKNYLFQPAEWDLSSTPSISTESSVGINTYVLHDENKVFRIIPRENDSVNDSWMTNSARNEHRHFDNVKRLTKILRNGGRIRLETAITNIVKSISARATAVVFSSNMSLEDQFMLRQLLDAVTMNIYFIQKPKKTDDFLTSSDVTPNFNGAVLNKLAIEKNICENLDQLDRKIKNNQIRRILSINEEIFSHGVSYAIHDSVEIFYIGMEDNKTSKRARIAIPTTTFFESTGTFINKDWRLQKFSQAINPSSRNIFPLWYIFSLILNVYFESSESNLLWLDEIWKILPKTYDQLAGVDFFNIDPRGVLLKKC